MKLYFLIQLHHNFIDNSIYLWILLNGLRLGVITASVFILQMFIEHLLYVQRIVSGKQAHPKQIRT